MARGLHAEPAREGGEAVRVDRFLARVLVAQVVDTVVEAMMAKHEFEAGERRVEPAGALGVNIRRCNRVAFRHRGSW